MERAHVHTYHETGMSANRKLPKNGLQRGGRGGGGHSVHKRAQLHLPDFYDHYMPTRLRRTHTAAVSRVVDDGEKESVAP